MLDDRIFERIKSNCSFDEKTRTISCKVENDKDLKLKVREGVDLRRATQLVEDRIERKKNIKYDRNGLLGTIKDYFYEESYNNCIEEIVIEDEEIKNRTRCTNKTRAENWSDWGKETIKSGVWKP